MVFIFLAAFQVKRMDTHTDDNMQYFIISCSENQLSICTKRLSLVEKYLALSLLHSSTLRGIMSTPAVHGGCYDSF